MAKLLNRCRPRVPSFESVPQSEIVSVRNKRFLLDSNSLAVYELSAGDVIEAIPLLHRKPQFHRGILTRPYTVIFEVTHKCNLRCRYCFVQDYEDKESKMKLELAKVFIERMFPRRARSEVSFGFFGGEPLLEWELVKDLVTYTRGYFPPVIPKYSMTTNGVLLNEKRAKFLADNNFSLIYSVDGSAEIHDQFRPMPDGRGSFEKVMKGLAFLKDAGAKNITLRATFPPEKTALLERVVFLNDLCDQGLSQHVSVEPSCLSETSCLKLGSKMAFEDPNDVRLLEEEYLSCADWMVERLNSGKRARFHSIGKFIERLLWSIHSPSECGAGVGYIALSPDGSICACHRERWSKIGSLTGGGIDEEARLKWIENRLYTRQGCLKCPIRWLCGGGCREMSLGMMSDITIPCPTECAFKWLFLKAALWVLSEVKQEVLMKFFPDPTVRRV